MDQSTKKQYAIRQSDGKERWLLKSPDMAGAYSHSKWPRRNNVVAVSERRLSSHHPFVSVDVLIPEYQ